MTEKLLARFADVVAIAVGVAFLVIVVPPFFASPPDPMDAVNVQLDAESVGVDFASSPRTLIMALHSECAFCLESMPFYRRVTNRMSDSQIVVAAMWDDTNVGQYLAQHKVVPDALVHVDAETLPVSGTPTLLMVDATGLVTHAWVGMLTPDLEADVLRAVLGPA